MIFYLVTPQHAYTMRSFLEHYGRRMAPILQVVTYDVVARQNTLPAGVYVFSDLDRLSQAQRELAKQLHDLLKSHGCPVLNDPSRVLGRYDLLDALWRSGQNRYRAWRVSEVEESVRLPVFLRLGNEHMGSLTPLIETRQDLEQVVLEAAFKGFDMDQLLVVEYLETSDAQGLYRKYSHFNFGGALVPRHLAFSSDWQVKVADDWSEDLDAEEWRYLHGAPHQEEALSVFALAGVEWGRLDYSLVDGQMQVWEINTNPYLSRPPQNYRKEHLPIQQWFADRAIEQIERLNAMSPEPRPIPPGFDLSFLSSSSNFFCRSDP